ncbi:hypothetical protein BD779DRAFT_1675774 [Infundibulicybe gibba]|nr:hypothetical protein BD779DRAFT_1675774 [Infundibulicybe gibba]
MEAHPAHIPLPPNAHQDAIDALDWVSTGAFCSPDLRPPLADQISSYRLVVSFPSFDPAPFTREECQSLIALLQSFDKRREAGAQIPLHTHTVSRVLLEVVRWRQYHFRPTKPLLANADRDGLVEEAIIGLPAVVHSCL